MSKNIKDFEVLRTGEFTDANGRKVKITETDLQEIAESFDPDLWKAPYVLGHPKDNDPVQGYPEKFYVKGKKLLVKTKQLFDDFKNTLKDGRVSKISLSIFDRESPANPTPGKLYVRHVGFLGPVPPAVSGLENVALSDDEDGHFEIELSYQHRVTNGIFRRLRDFLIDNFSLDVANQIIPDYEIQSITEEQAREDEKNHGHAFSEPSNEDNPMPKELTPEQKIAKLEADLAAANTKNKTLETNLSENAKTQRNADFVTFCDQLVQDKKLVPAMRDLWVEFAAEFPQEEIEFSEGSATFHEKAKALLKTQNKILDFTEKSNPDKEPKPHVNFTAPAGQEVDEKDLEDLAKVQAYAKKHECSMADAAKAVGV